MHQLIGTNWFALYLINRFCASILIIVLSLLQYKKEIEPPYKPSVSDALDVSNIDSAFTEELPTVTPTPHDSVLANEHAFDGFTFNESDSILSNLDSFKSLDGETLMAENAGIGFSDIDVDISDSTC